EMLHGKEGGYSKHYPDGKEDTIYDVAMAYQKEGVPLVVIGGKEYGTGSSRDWAAKGTLLLGVKAVVAESFERIHRSNLVGVGVLPLMFKEGTTRQTLGLKGDEVISIKGLEHLKPRMDVTMVIKRHDGSTQEVPLLCRIDTFDEVEYYRHGGVLQYVLRGMVKNA
ncbi:MAG: aconitate hydratase, partial [Acetobacter sp.]|nr:aconitate hydratase [Acetobacter sp.]